MFDKGIEAFVAIANSRSISAAAELLCITQPACDPQAQRNWRSRLA